MVTLDTFGMMTAGALTAGPVADLLALGLGLAALLHKSF